LEIENKPAHPGLPGKWLLKEFVCVRYETDEYQMIALSIQYHELKLINIVLSYTMPWRSINDLTK